MIIAHLLAALGEVRTVVGHVLGIPVALVRIPLHLLRALERTVTAVLVKLHIVQAPAPAIVVVPAVAEAPAQPSSDVQA